MEFADARRADRLCRAALNKLIVASSDPVPVWPSAKGTARGVGLAPLYPSVPEAALRNEKLYALLALFDALRSGQARERNAARDLLEDFFSESARPESRPGRADRADAGFPARGARLRRRLCSGTADDGPAASPARVKEVAKAASTHNELERALTRLSRSSLEESQMKPALIGASLFAVALLQSAPAAAQDMAAMEKWAKVEIVHYEVVGNSPGSMCRFRPRMRISTRMCSSA
ncbi:MAG: hypothetical protein M5R42_15165 [Rhodocyclaceae bacterium]|nr:hypothetical protein [Rhodocyclaceae bacterium]